MPLDQNAIKELKQIYFEEFGEMATDINFKNKIKIGGQNALIKADLFSAIGKWH